MKKTKRLDTLKSKDWTPTLIFALPLLFLVLFMFWPLVTTVIRAFLGPGNKTALSGFSFENFNRFITSSMYQRSQEFPRGERLGRILLHAHRNTNGLSRGQG